MSQSSVTTGLWESIQAELRKLFPRDTYETWFVPVRCLDQGQDSLILSVPNEFAAIWMQENYLDLLRKLAQESSGGPMEVVLRADPVAAPATPARDRLSLAGSRREGHEPVPRMSPESARRNLFLNPRNTFENFVVGGSNQLAHAAATAVARAPGKAYNPLFLYGDTGLGKTHLMHAMAHAILDRDPEATIIYASCEKFTNEFMRAIQDNTLVKFRRFYRGVDVLLIDDVQFLEGKERTQEEFFHTFNELFESGRQICLSSDRPALEISKLESRLISRFQWGMVTDIQAPDLETRLAILKKKAATHHYPLSAEVLQFLAQRVTRNVRRMEGALIKVATAASLMKCGIDLATVERLIQDILQEEALHQITIDRIQKKVVEYYDLRASDMVSKRRPANIAFPRQVAMYLCRVLTNHPLKEIGEAFGGRDHGTVIHACKTVENIMEQDESVRRSVDYLTKQLATH